MPPIQSLNQKLTTARLIFAQSGLSGLTQILLKKICPSGNYVFSWDNRVLLECPPIYLATLESTSTYHAKVFRDDEAHCLVGINNQSIKSVRAAIKRNEVCWALMEGEKLLSYVWISQKKSPICSDTAFLLPNVPENYWWRDIYITPEYRGTGKINEHLYHWFQSIENTGDNSLFCEISPDNTPSLIAHKRNGFTVIGTLKMICVLGCRFYYLSTPQTSDFSYRFYPRNIYYS